ncbi:MAG: hypothetical protein M3296_03070 [Actinomycetota bacterium]|nr:hypothetical protein [Actinomycetota bacterium]
MRHELPGLAITIAGEDQHSSSTITAVGGYVVVVATALPTAAVTLTSVYVGQIGGDTALTHLRLAPGRAAELHQRTLAGHQPGQTHTRTCLLDHTAELQQLLAELTDQRVSIAIAPAALQRAERAWASPDQRA